MMSAMNDSFSLTPSFLNSRLKKPSKHSRIGIKMQTVSSRPFARFDEQGFQIRREKVKERRRGPVQELLPNGNDVGVEGKFFQNRKFIRKRSRNAGSNTATEGMPICKAEQLKTSASHPCAIFEINCKSWNLPICCAWICLNFQSCLCICSSLCIFFQAFECLLPFAGWLVGIADWLLLLDGCVPFPDSCLLLQNDSVLLSY